MTQAIKNNIIQIFLDLFLSWKHLMKVITNERNTNIINENETLFNKAWNIIHKNIFKHLKFLINNLMSLKKSMKNTKTNHATACLDEINIKSN